MIRTLLALDGGLVRGALAYVLSAHEDVEVVTQLSDLSQVEATIRAERPDVSVVDFDLLTLADMPRACAVYHELRPCRVLVLVDPRRASYLAPAMSRHSAEIGFLSKNAAPERIVDAVLSLARGEVVIDAELVAAALDPRGPLTSREVEILDIAAGGRPVREIAATLGISPGTVRNHLSRVMHKLGANTRIEAVRIARKAGWI